MRNIVAYIQKFVLIQDYFEEHGFFIKSCFILILFYTLLKLLLFRTILYKTYAIYNKNYTN